MMIRKVLVMSPSEKRKIARAYALGSKSRSTQEYYATVIKQIADTLPKGVSGDGDAPEDPSLEMGKVR